MTAYSEHSAPARLHRGLILLLLLVAANLFAWRTVEPDLWGHIQYGEDWLHNGVMPRTATHTYSTPEHPWVNHENLFELAVAAGQRTVGGHGLMIFKCVAGMWLVWLMIRNAARRRISTLPAVVCMIPVASGLGEFWLARPQLFSFLFFGLMLVAFERAFHGTSGGRKIRFGWLWLMVPVMVLWTNSHGGFAAGLCVFIAMCALRALQQWLTRQPDAPATTLHLAALSFVMCCSVLINPYGYELPWWMIVSLSQPRPEVSEWANILDGGVTAIPFVALTLLTLLSLRYTRHARDWAEIIVLGLIAVQTLGHVRHLAFFAIAFGFWMPQHMTSLWDRIVEWRPTLGTHEPMSANAARLLTAEFGIVAALLAGLLGYSLGSFGVDRDKYPVSAIEFMAEENVSGRLVVTFDWAQYALAALAPSTTVGFDGRYDTCYPQEVVDMNFDLLFGYDLSRRCRGAESGPVNPDRVLEFGNPNLVLVNRTADAAAVHHLSSHPNWIKLYQDGRAVLWGRRSEFDNPDHPRYLPPNHRRVTDAHQHGMAKWPGFPGRTGRNAFSPEAAAAAENQRRTSRDLSFATERGRLAAATESRSSETSFHSR